MTKSVFFVEEKKLFIASGYNLQQEPRTGWILINKFFRVFALYDERMRSSF